MSILTSILTCYEAQIIGPPRRQSWSRGATSPTGPLRVASWLHRARPGRAPWSDSSPCPTWTWASPAHLRGVGFELRENEPITCHHIAMTSYEPIPSHHSHDVILFGLIHMTSNHSIQVVIWLISVSNFIQIFDLVE